MNLVSSHAGRLVAGVLVCSVSAVSLRAAGGLIGPVWDKVGGHDAVQFGWSVSPARDVNGDGLPDAVVGSWRFGPSAEGGAFLYLGTSSGLSTTAAWSPLGPQSGSGFGGVVADAGDINGDGYDDVLVGAEYFDNWRGLASAFYGGPIGPSSIANWTASSAFAGSRFSDAMCGAGDVDGDGFDDVLVGAWWHTNTAQDEGAVYFYRGGPNGLQLTEDLRIEGGIASGLFGGSVAGAGDVNGDGYADVLIGASGDNEAPVPPPGRAFLYYGSPTGLSTSADWTFSSGQPGSQLSVARVGDLNGDGFADIGMSAPLFDDGEVDEGRIYVFFGGSSGPAVDPDWVYAPNQANARLGRGLAAAGDVSGDQIDDLIVGAITYSNGEPQEGAVFVFLGSACGLAAGPSWMVESNQSDARMGISVAGVGDVTNDGTDDVMIGFQLWDATHSDEGRVVVYAGQPLVDCNGNRTEDADDLLASTSADCNQNSIPDECDLRCGTSIDVNSNGVPDECEPTILPFCFGDATGFGCPCGNTGDPGHGCISSFGTLGGGLLVGTGSTSVGGDTVCLAVSHLPTTTTGLLFQGQQQVNGGMGRWFGDGLRCVTSSVVRLGARVASAGSIAWGSCVPGDPSISSYEPVPAGATRHFQVWYRNADPSFCTPSPFNLTNGVTVLWGP